MVAPSLNALPALFIKLLLLVIAFASFALAAPVPEAFSPLKLGEVHPEGWIRAQLSRDLATGFHGHLDELLQDRRTGEYLLQATNNDYITRAKNKASRQDHQGRTIPAAPQSWWHAEMVGDWYDSLIRAAFLTDDTQALAKCEAYVNALLKSQDPDGYIGIYPKGRRYHFASADGELWTQRCAFLGLLAYHEFTGRKDVLEAVERGVKLTLRQYKPEDNYFDNPKQPNSGVSHGLLFVDVLEWLYRLTGDRSYARAAVALYDDYSSSKRVANKAAQLDRLLDPQQPLGGHGPDIMGFLRVPLLSYYLTGKPEYQQAWANSVLKLERHVGVGGSPLSGHHEEIKVEGQTPDMPYEYCSTFYLMHSLIWAMQKEGHAKYGDLYERALYNAAQGARFSNGKALTYYSADERLWVRQNPPEGTANHRFIYTAAHYPSCCHNSGARIYPYTIPAMWMRSQDKEGEGLVLSLYGPSRVTTRLGKVPVTIVEKTSYPFAHEIELSIEPQRSIRFPLRLRVPAWSQEPELNAAGAKVTRDERGFLVVTKKWKKGDTVRLKLKPGVQAREAANNTRALAYGPLVFSLPIPEKAEVVQEFPRAEAKGIKGFYGYQYDPADLASAKRPLKLKHGEAGSGFKVVRDLHSSLDFPWDAPPLRLEGELVGHGGLPERVTLLPMGSTLLRRTCFRESD